MSIVKAIVRQGTFSNGNKLNNFSAPMVSGPVKSNYPELGQYVMVLDTSNPDYCQGHIPSRRKNMRVFLNDMNDVAFVNDANEAAFVNCDVDLMNMDSVNTGSRVSNIQIEQIPVKTDDEIREEIAEKFGVLDDMIEGLADGFCRSLAVAGDAGTGKSFSAEKILQASGVKYTILKGTVSPIMLYVHLYEHSDKNQVLVLDDVEVWQDVEALAMLKAVLDTSKTRRVYYSKVSSYLEEKGIPNDFEFNGACLFLSNMNFNREISRNSKVAPHLLAILSRSHFISVNLDTLREKLIRIMMICESDEFRNEHGLSVEENENILEWVKSNGEKLREVSIRTVVKLAQLIKAKPHKWALIAKHTLCR